MRIYIITDLEGVGGVLLPQQVQPGDPMYERARLLLTHEVNAAIEGALEGGAREILVLDGHGANSAYNFVLEELHPEAQYIMGVPWQNYLPGLNETFDAVFEVGFHSMAGTMKGVYDHTMSWDGWVNMTVNGIRMGEIGFCAAFAGHFGIPVALVTGDKAACEEATSLLGDVCIVSVKEGISRFSAKCLHPIKIRELIKERAKQAIDKIHQIKPLNIGQPVEIKIEYSTTDLADGIKPKIKDRKDARTMVCRGDTIIEAWENLH